MARIEFRPVCSACKQVIRQVVNFSEGVVNDTIGCFIPICPTIEPSKCPHCGAQFKSIIMTDRLPFNDFPEEDKNDW